MEAVPTLFIPSPHTFELTLLNIEVVDNHCHHFFWSCVHFSRYKIITNHIKDPKQFLWYHSNCSVFLRVIMRSATGKFSKLYGIQSQSFVFLHYLHILICQSCILILIVPFLTEPTLNIYPFIYSFFVLPMHRGPFVYKEKVCIKRADYLCM